MAKEKTLTAAPSGSSSSSTGNSLLGEFFHAGLYKPNQGKAVRQVTFAAAAAAVAFACWEISGWVGARWSNMQYPIPLALLLVGLWACYRLVNIPRFADFLIAVQAEVNKVSWPSQQELIRSSLVVIFVIFILAIVLFGFDLAWMALFQAIGILKK